MIIDLGLIDYEDSYRIQKEFVVRRKTGEVEDTLILAEHRNVFTIGRTGKRENLLVDEDILAKAGIKVLGLDRGGDITFHGPGQLIFYPIIDLKNRGKDLHRYLKDLESVAIDLLKEYSIAGERIDGKTGVWVRGQKIASIGVAVSNWVTYHGLALNVDVDLGFFSMIHPCGMKGVKVTSIASLLKRRIATSEVKERILPHFINIFGLAGEVSHIKNPRPYWLNKRLVASEDVFETRRVLEESHAATVCESSLCPNSNECFSKKTATFLILGNTCSRSCGFCSVNKGVPAKVDEGEPDKILDAAGKLNLKYVIVTSVTRDDLPDGGAAQFVNVIDRIRRLSPAIGIEVLIPDFSGNMESLRMVLKAKPDILGHNVETARRLYPIARRNSDYSRSIDLLRSVKDINKNQLTKSGIMLGLGEHDEEIVDTIRDIRVTGCDIVTIGQYLRPRRENLQVKRFFRPEEFERYKKIAVDMGFKYVASGPFVRSSYCAEEIYEKISEVVNDGCSVATNG